MGHRKTHAPRHGSLAYRPRKRAKQMLGRIRFWPTITAEKPSLLGFIGYKAGMTHIFRIEDRKRSPDFGKEVMRSVSVLETPPVHICGIRAYTRTSDGLKTINEVWMQTPPNELNRLLTPPEKYNTDEDLKKMDENIDDVCKLRLITITQPKQTSVPKKKPDIAEIEIGGGTIQQQLDYAKTILGKTVTPQEIFKEGQHIDIISVSVGKGFQGPVKRFGVTKLQHKGRKTKRGVATLGPWNPHHIMYSVARAGQMGCHQRTEHNKRILKIGNDGKEVTPKGGFLRYGVVKGSYIIVEGSIAGTEKRAIRLRVPARPPSNVSEDPLQITHISLETQQGR